MTSEPQPSGVDTQLQQTECGRGSDLHSENAQSLHPLLLLIRATNTSKLRATKAGGGSRQEQEEAFVNYHFHICHLHLIGSAKCEAPTSFGVCSCDFVDRVLRATDGRSTKSHEQTPNTSRTR